MKEVGSVLASITKKYGLEIETSSEEVDLSEYGVRHGKCIDDELVAKQLLGDEHFTLKKDKGQRKGCGFAQRIDIGASNTCTHFCSYCYANVSELKRTQVSRSKLSIISGGVTR
ncbi:hypothetical protein HLPCO_002155 [Haloplasma contractile SSD-17B]|uniref:Uncharacterized protein n=1 Tax=Haloplasma contractile SSD-17B TaxID=1033810 RepID=U2FGA6_9MOLU|nr:hypothetical protein HLPCO_002155 [Haloplasma contractile SSD-17B]